MLEAHTVTDIQTEESLTAGVDYTLQNKNSIDSIFIFEKTGALIDGELGHLVKPYDYFYFSPEAGNNIWITVRSPTVITLSD